MASSFFSNFRKKLFDWYIIRRFICIRVLMPTMTRFNRIIYKYYPDPDKMIRIKIDRISGWYSKDRYEEFTYRGMIRGGEWKRVRKRTIKETFLYKTMHQRFIEGLPWKSTDVFKDRYIKKIETGRKARGYSTLAGIENHYIKCYDALYEDIKENGVREVPEENTLDRMHAHIHKNGELIWTLNGNHRLSIIYILGIEEIEVYVWMRHREWQRKREVILEAVSKGSEVPADLKKYMNHPDILPEIVELRCHPELVMSPTVVSN